MPMHDGRASGLPVSGPGANGCFPESRQDGAPAFRLDLVRATGGVLWRDARRVCDEALAQGHAFVAIVHGAAASADERLLAPEDRQRADRFRRIEDRQNFVLGRCMIHHLVRPLGAIAPCVVSVDPRGKPFVPGAPACNLSHSGRWVACAVSPGAPIGVDVETFERLRDYRDLLPTIVHPAERRWIEQAAAERQQAWFKRCWARKEAAIKATGMGLGAALGTIDVRLDEREPVLGHPAPLRLVDLLPDEVEPTIAVALDPTVSGLVALLVR